MLKKMVRIAAFMMILLGLLVPIENVLKSEWMYPRKNFGAGEILYEFYDITKRSDMQAVFIGASTFCYDIDPMRIYDDTGIVTYDFSTGGQPLAVSYCYGQEMFKTQKPKVVILDATWAFPGSFSIYGYHYLLDEMRFCKEKLELAAYYAKAFVENEGNDEKKLDAFIGALWPLYQFHDRWSSLSEVDFMPEEYGNLYRRGYRADSEDWPTSLTVEKMDGIAQELSNQSGWQISVGGVR